MTRADGNTQLGPPVVSSHEKIDKKTRPVQSDTDVGAALSDKVFYVLVGVTAVVLRSACQVLHQVIKIGSESLALLCPCTLNLCSISYYIFLLHVPITSSKSTRHVTIHQLFICFTVVPWKCIGFHINPTRAVFDLGFAWSYHGQCGTS